MSLEPRDRDADLDAFIPKRDRQRHREESARPAEEGWRRQREDGLRTKAERPVCWRRCRSGSSRPYSSRRSLREREEEVIAYLKAQGA
jgi:hypothetical protein